MREGYNHLGAARDGPRVMDLRLLRVREERQRDEEDDVDEEGAVELEAGHLG